MIEVFTLGGYNEVGKNMTAVKVGDEIIILDMGLHLEKYISIEKDEDDNGMIDPEELARAGAIPNDMPLDRYKSQVKAIVITHAHLDHVGAVPYLAKKYKAPIVCTPYTAEIIKTIASDDGFIIPNRLKILNPNSTYPISNKLKIEFINATHSVPQTVMVALHTSEGIVLYANDFKFDNFPIIGKKTDLKRLGELQKKGVAALIVDCTRAKDAKKTPSETVAKEMLRDVMLGTENSGKIMIVTTFSSHLARLQSIIEFGKKLHRKIIFLGRSLSKYVAAGEKIGLVHFSREVEIVRYSKRIKKRLRQIDERSRGKYLLVVTGHQAEPGSVLSKMIDGELGFSFRQEDSVIFSCTIIPTQENFDNRERMEEMLRERKVRIFKDIHVSGHASREDHRDLINLVRPRHIIPAHGDTSMTVALAELAIEMGYKIGKNIHITQNGKKITL